MHSAPCACSPSAPHIVDIVLSMPPVCNDGTPAAYYYRRGEDASRWVVHQQGGWWCWDEYSCQVRWDHFANHTSEHRTLMSESLHACTLATHEIECDIRVCRRKLQFLTLPFSQKGHIWIRVYAWPDYYAIMNDTRFLNKYVHTRRVILTSGWHVRSSTQSATVHLVPLGEKSTF